jgi:hypothetical protein
VSKEGVINRAYATYRHVCDPTDLAEAHKAFCSSLRQSAILVFQQRRDAGLGACVAAATEYTEHFELA